MRPKALAAFSCLLALCGEFSVLLFTSSYLSSPYRRPSSVLSSSAAPAAGGTSSSPLLKFRECYDLVRHALNGGQHPRSAHREFCQAPCVREIREALHRHGIELFGGHDLRGTAPRPRLNSSDVRRKRLVLINSPGGVSSTFFVDVVRTMLHLDTNDMEDMDGLKHLDVQRMDLRSEGFLVTIHQRCYRQTTPGPRPCTPKEKIKWNATTSYIYRDQILPHYARVVYVVNDPVHAVFSLYNRGWEKAQYVKLCETCRMPEEWVGNITALFEASAKAGYDVWGTQNQSQQWIDLQDRAHFGGIRQMIGSLPVQDTAQPGRTDSAPFSSASSAVPEFPPILVTDVRTAEESPIILAGFLGVSVDQIKKFMYDRAKNNQAIAQQRDKERELLRRVGAWEVYDRLEQHLYDVVAQNYIFYGIKLFCKP